MADPRGDRPESEIEAIAARIVELQGEYAALSLLLSGALQDRIAFVERHRRRLAKDARRETEGARDRGLKLIDELEQACAEVIALNETRIWAECFPHETLQTMPPSLEIARLRERWLSRPGDLPAPSVFNLLRDDLRYFSEVPTTEQAALAQGVSTAELTDREAAWDGSPAALARQKREREMLQEAHRRTWGQDVPQFYK